MDLVDPTTLPPQKTPEFFEGFPAHASDKRLQPPGMDSRQKDLNKKNWPRSWKTHRGPENQPPLSEWSLVIWGFSKEVSAKCIKMKYVEVSELILKIPENTSLETEKHLQNTNFFGFQLLPPILSENLHYLFFFSEKLG